VLDTNISSYVFWIARKNQLQHVYWGKRLWRDNDLATPPLIVNGRSFDGTAVTNSKFYAAGEQLSNTEACLKIPRQ